MVDFNLDQLPLYWTWVWIESLTLDSLISQSFVRQRPRLQQNDLCLAIQEITPTNGLTSGVIGVMLPLQARSNLTKIQDSGISPLGSWEFAKLIIHWLIPVASTSREELLKELGTLTNMPWNGLKNLKDAVEANEILLERHALLQLSLLAEMGFNLSSSVLKLWNWFCYFLHWIFI